MVFMVGIFVGCDNESATTTKDYQYSDYSYYQVKSFEDQLEFQDGTYYVYYYSEGCTACQSIKEDILSRITGLKTDTLLLFDVYNNTVGIEPSFNIVSTPTLIRVKDHEFDEAYVGVSKILAVLDDLA